MTALRPLGTPNSPRRKTIVLANKEAEPLDRGCRINRRAIRPPNRKLRRVTTDNARIVPTVCGQSPRDNGFPAPAIGAVPRSGRAADGVCWQGGREAPGSRQKICGPHVPNPDILLKSMDFLWRRAGIQQAGLARRGRRQRTDTGAH